MSGGVLALTQPITHTGHYQQTGGQLQVTLTDRSHYGRLNVTGDINISSAATLKLQIPNLSSIQDGDTFDVLTVDGNDTCNGIVLEPITSAVYNFTKETGPNGKGVKIRATRPTLAAVVTKENGPTKIAQIGGIGQIASIIDSILDSPNTPTGFTTLFNQLAQLSDQAKVNQALSMLINDINFAILKSNSIIDATVFAKISERLNILNVAESQINLFEDTTGYSAGSKTQDNSMWIQAYGTKGNQKQRPAAVGYDADTQGFVLGVDTHVTPDLIMGVSGNYAYTDVYSKNQVRNKTKIKTFQGSLYGSYALGHLNFEGLIHYAMLDYESMRNIVIGNLAYGAVGEYRGNQYGARVAVSHPIKINKLGVYPSIFASRNKSVQDRYTETNADSFALNVKRVQIQQFELGVGLMMNYLVKNSYGDFLPRVSLNVSRDVMAKNIPSTFAFVGGGAPFSAMGNPVDKNTLELSPGFDMTLPNQIKFSADYHIAKKKNYVGQSGSFTLRYLF